MTTWEIVPPYAVEVVFPRVAKYLQKAISVNKMSGYTIAALRRQVLNNEVLLAVDSLLDPNNAVVFKLEEWQGEPTCYIQFLGGRGKGRTDWNDALQQLAEYARGYGYNRFVTHMRHGFTKKKLKYRPLAILAELEIPDG